MFFAETNGSKHINATFHIVNVSYGSQSLSETRKIDGRKKQGRRYSINLYMYNDGRVRPSPRAVTVVPLTLRH